MKIKFLYLLFLFSFLFLVPGPWSIVHSPSPALADAGWDNGFYIKSEDGQFKMNIGGRVQFLESIEKRRGAEKVATGAGGKARVTQAADNFADSFSIRRARIQTTGTIFEKLDWFTILNVRTAAAGATPTTVWFAGLTYNLLPTFRVSGGMIQLPLDRQGELSSAWFLTVEPPITATQKDGVKGRTIARDSLGLPFDLGLRMDGDIGSHFSYAAGLANGAGSDNLNTNNELSYSGSIQFNVWDKVPPNTETDFENSERPKLAFNLGGGFEDEDAADENVAGITRRGDWVGSGGTAFRWHGFALNSELYYRVIKLSAPSVEDTNKDSKLKDVGYYTNVGYYFIPKKLEGVLTAAQIFREGPDNNANEFGGGVNWYVHGNHAKLQLNYINFLDYDEVPGLNNATFHRIRLMFSMFL